jgi:aerobic-type carbon monoxide dehydrogenase small subunit (CoxS/CutS family)
VSDESSLTLVVNGSSRTVSTAPDTPLIYVLRNDLGLTGAKLGCGLEQCGACAVLVDEVSTLSCSSPVALFAERRITTPEAQNDAVLKAVRDAFVETGAAQCGYCIPGLVIAVTALLKRNPHPSDQEAQAALQPHLCRCGTHTRILNAVRALSARATPP